MRHYFLETKHEKSDYFKFQEYYMGQSYVINSCSDVFSKNSLDMGSKTLVEAIVQSVQVKGEVLDMGCGYGFLGIAMKKHFSDMIEHITMVDVNSTAVELAKKNVFDNKLKKSDFTIMKSDLYQELPQDKKYDYIITNPPIKVGKKVLHELLAESINYLKDNGELLLVVRKDHGADSVKKLLEKTYGNCEVIKRNKGYYILRSVNGEV